MSTRRWCPAYAQLSGRLYVIGGRDIEKIRFNSVECYEPLADRWQAVAPMNHGRSNATACALNGLIYVFGGLSGGGYVFRSIESYDPDKDLWLKVRSVLRILSKKNKC